MQSRPTNRLARKLASYARKHSFPQTAKKFGILSPDGKPSAGMVHMLIHGYEPRRPETRTRIGLPEIIPVPVHHRTINDHLANDSIQDMPTPLLQWAFENRQEMQ